MPIDSDYLPFFENVISKGDDSGEKIVTKCFNCVSSRLFLWRHPQGFDEPDFRPLEVIDMEAKQSERKKKFNQSIGRVYCLHLKQFVPQAQYLVECRFFLTASDYEFKKRRKAERENHDS